jgi:hypothetical protein
MPSLRFEDENLQKRFTEKLLEASFSFKLDQQDGAVLFDEKDRPSINGIAHAVRDGCYRWYFSWGMSPETAEKFENVLKSKGMLFQVEYQDDEKVYLLPKADEQEHQEIIADISDV